MAHGDSWDLQLDQICNLEERQKLLTGCRSSFLDDIVRLGDRVESGIGMENVLLGVERMNLLVDGLWYWRAHTSCGSQRNDGLTGEIIGNFL